MGVTIQFICGGGIVGLTITGVLWWLLDRYFCNSATPTQNAAVPENPSGTVINNNVNATAGVIPNAKPTPSTGSENPSLVVPENPSVTVTNNNVNATAGVIPNANPTPSTGSENPAVTVTINDVNGKTGKNPPVVVGTNIGTIIYSSRD